MKKNVKIGRIIPFIMIGAALVGLTASFALTYDKIQVLRDANYSPSCNINPIFSCGSVMKTEQANLLGLPNTLFGIAAFSMLLAFGLMLTAGAKLKRWVWQAAQIAALSGVIFMHYLFFQSVYRINAICVWCFSVWMVTIPVFWYLTIYNLQEGNTKLPNKLSNFILRYHFEVLIVWYVLLFAILLKEFWYYWSTLV